MKPSLTAGLVLVTLLGADAGRAAPREGQHAVTRLDTQDRLETPRYLPEVLRPVLRRRMKDHGEDLMELVLSVTLLRRDTAKAAAERIAREPRLARPIAGAEDELNAALPERFFVLQDELRSRAQAVAAATAGKDDVALAGALGTMMQSCVACHALFLNPPPTK